LGQEGVVTGSIACGTGRNCRDREEFGHEGIGTGRCRDKKKIETGISREKRKELGQEGCCVGWRELGQEGVGDRKKMETGMSWERKELVQEGCCVGWRKLRVEGVEVLR
jgi:hypothetical protein